ncbi:MAG: glutamine amidotransferase [Peptococcaceae bacterium]|nr:glutamine amidotransferase [Peptococcaceae bacterium]
MIRVGHLYPDILNAFGDNGNVTAFEKRCHWRDIPCVVDQIRLGDEVDFGKYHAVFLGGGLFREQSLIRAELLKMRDNLKETIEDGLVVLAIDSGFQLLGKYYQDSNYDIIDGLGILDCYTRIGEKRLVGNVTVDLKLTGESYHVFGFANHLGETFINDNSPLGKVLYGTGNNNKDNGEGLRYKNVFCSYLHGPLLPVNPRLADYLIELAVEKSGLLHVVEPLPDIFEEQARAACRKRMGI